MKYASKKTAREIIAKAKESYNTAYETAYFDGSVTLESMYEMLVYRMQFGHAEACVIIASLINSGAKFEVCGAKFEV